MTSLTAGVTALEANVTPGAPSQTTGHPSEPGDIFESSRLDCHQTAEIGAFSYGRSAPAVGVRTRTWGEEKR
jgi:hypothetical protein